jgi:CRP/FNR family transcriptional regulator, cyclic AMP receptor protein
MTDDNKKNQAMRPVSDCTIGKVRDLILGVPLFEDMDPKEVEVLSRYFKLYSVDEGAVIFHEGDEGGFMGLIIEGNAEVSKENYPLPAVTISTEGFGKALGEMALFDRERRSATVKFTKPGKVLLLTKESFDTIRENYPRVGFDVLWRLCRILSQRLRRTTGLLSHHLHESEKVAVADFPKIGAQRNGTPVAVGA